MKGQGQLGIITGAVAVVFAIGLILGGFLGYSWGTQTIEGLTDQINTLETDNDELENDISKLNNDKFRLEGEKSALASQLENCNITTLELSDEPLNISAQTTVPINNPIPVYFFSGLIFVLLFKFNIPIKLKNKSKTALISIVIVNLALSALSGYIFQLALSAV